MKLRWFIRLGLLVALLVAGCADNAAPWDSDKRGGFYGGISGSGTWP